MKTFQAEQFVMRYLEASGCKILEKGDGYVTVKLSPEADKDLMNRSYYWSYVEQFGLEPVPAVLTLVFDPDRPPPDGRQRLLVGGLHPDLELKEPRRHSRQEGQFLFGQQIGPDLEMKPRPVAERQ